MENLEAAVEFVTPELAREWLTANPHNRRLKQGKINEYARAMRAGRWMLNGEGIQISTEGGLLNGQHRLNAIIAADVTVAILIVRGVAPETKVTFDGHAKRTPSDVLDLDRRGGHSTRLTASVARFALWFECNGRRNYSNVEVSDYVAEHPSMVEACDDAVRYTKIPGGTPSVIAYAYWRLRDIDADGCDTFFQALREGTDLPAGDPILALSRTWIAKMNRPRGVGDGWSDRQEKIAELFHAWNAWRAGRTLRKHIRPGRDHKGRMIIAQPQ